MPKIILIDTVYPDYLASLPPIPDGVAYSVELRRVLDRGFGTADFYSHYLRFLGWEAVDAVANYRELQMLWLRDNGKWTEFGNPQAVVLEQIEVFKPDVIFMQDLSFFGDAELESLRRKYMLAGQCSCPMPPAERVSKFHLLFTSFPHYLERFKSMGVGAQYLPLAFDPRMIPEECERDIDISFVGGALKNSHWTRGTNILEEVAHQFGGQFKWFGYGQTDRRLSPALRACWSGPAWGREMYAVYARSKIVINRHGEVAEGFANNLRMFESTGCGAMLLTEDAPNLTALFPRDSVATYSGASDLCERIRIFLDRPERLGEIAVRGQAQTLAVHSYENRMEVVSDALERMLSAKAGGR